MRSCQPGPSPWKWSRTSRSMRRETISLAPGSDGAAFGIGIGSGGLVVAALKAASAAWRESVGLRDMPVSPLFTRDDGGIHGRRSWPGWGGHAQRTDMVDEGGRTPVSEGHGEEISPTGNEVAPVA